MKQELIEKLSKGETIKYREKGNSMLPLIKSGELLTAIPTTVADLEVGDICFCRVKGSTLTHLVTAKDTQGRVQISNNKGHVNGWTKTVFGKIVKVEP